MAKKLSGKSFVLSQVIILTLGAAALYGLSYYLNLDFKNLNLKNYNPVTAEPISFNLDIFNPEDNFLSFDKSIVISGKTSPQATVIISGRDFDLGLEANTKGEFSNVITLSPGLNTISVSAFDNTGISKTVNKTIYYSVEKL